MYLFDDYTLDIQLYELRHAGVLCPLEPQVFDILLHLIQHRDRVVSREELLEHVWPERFISEATLDHRVMEARQAIGDSGQRQGRIKTLRGRGYRFVASVEECSAAGRQEPAASGSPAVLVGRHAELMQLRQWYTAALQGRRQVVCVTGEAGIGKTTLVDTFLAQVIVPESVWVGRGQCLEQHGPGEAYLPLLEALGQIGRAPDGARLVTVLHQQAPSWLAHLPGLVSPETSEALQQRASGSTRERMLRELAEALEVLTAQQPLILVLEDLHWSDGATLDWLAYVARRRAAARLLVLGTYRPAAALVLAHPVRSVIQEIQLHGQCAELGLDYFSTDEVATYLGQRFARAALPEGLARVLHRRTHGNPLFLATLVEGLVRQGVLQDGEVGWSLPGGLATVAAGVPENLRQLLAWHLEQLPTVEQTLLEAASVAGREFAVAAVAAALDRTVEDVEALCATLARRRAVPPCVWDGRLARWHDRYALWIHP